MGTPGTSPNRSPAPVDKSARGAQPRIARERVRRGVTAVEELAARLVGIALLRGALPDAAAEPIARLQHDGQCARLAQPLRRGQACETAANDRDLHAVKR